MIGPGKNLRKRASWQITWQAALRPALPVLLVTTGLFGTTPLQWDRSNQLVAAPGPAGQQPPKGSPAAIKGNEGDVTTSDGSGDYAPKDWRVHFAHRLTTTFSASQAQVDGLPNRDFYGWRVIFKKFFRPTLSRDLVDHEDSLINPYVVDVNYRTRRIPRNIELNQGDESNINIEVNRAAFNLLGFADNRGVIAGVGVAVEKQYPFRTADRHFGAFNAMMRLTDQHRHSFDFLLSAAQSEVIDREYANHYGGTVAYTYYHRLSNQSSTFFKKVDTALPLKLYGYAITEFKQRQSDNTALEKSLLTGFGEPFASFQFRDLDRQLEPRRRDAVAFSADPRVVVSPIGLELRLFGFVQQEEHKETNAYANSKANPLTFREDGIGYRTRFYRYGLELERVTVLTPDLDLRVALSEHRVRRDFEIRYEVPLRQSDYQPTEPIATGLRDIISDCSFSFDGLRQNFDCRRSAHDRQRRAYLELEVRRVFLDGYAALPGQRNVPHDRMRFRLSLVRYDVGRDPQTNLFSDSDLNKLIFIGELDAVPLGNGTTLSRNQTQSPATKIRNEVRLDMAYELTGFDFAHTVP